MRTFWIAQWKTGLKRLKTFDNKEQAEYYRDNCSLNGSVEIIKVEEKKVAKFEMAFGGYSTSDLEEEYKEFNTEEEEAPLFQHPDEWAKAMRDGRKFRCEGIKYSYNTEYENPFRVHDAYGGTVGLRDSWKYYNKVTEITEPEWYEDLGEGVWCKVWDKEEKSDIAKILSVVLTGIYPYKSSHTAWKHAEPIPEELAKMLEKEIK